MKQFILSAIVMMVCLPCAGFAEPPGVEQENRVEISKLAQSIADQHYAPLKVVVVGENLEEALVQAAFKVRAHIGLESSSPVFCRCVNQMKIIPTEERQLLKSWEHAVTRTDGGESRVTLVINLDAGKLKQLAYFGLWPLFSKHFVSGVST